jgi:hypothetical protein
MGCDGRRVAKVFGEMAKLAAGHVALHQAQEANPKTVDVVLSRALAHAENDYAGSKYEMARCSKCSDVWIELMRQDAIVS